MAHTEVQVLVAIPANAYNTIVTASAAVGVKPTGYITKKLLDHFKVPYSAMVGGKVAAPLSPQVRSKTVNVRIPDVIAAQLRAVASRQGRPLTTIVRALIAKTCGIPIADMRLPKSTSHRGPGKKWNMKCTCCGQEHIFNREKRKWEQTDGPIYDDVPEEE